MARFGLIAGASGSVQEAHGLGRRSRAARLGHEWQRLEAHGRRRRELRHGVWRLEAWAALAGGEW